MKTNAVQERKGIVTLCGSSGCCPTVDFSQKDVVIIRDDFGGHVMLSNKEWAALQHIKKKEHL